MAELAPDAQIVSVEHDPAWFYKAKQVLGELPNVDMRLRELSLRPRNYGYVTWPLAYSLETGTKFDFVFIDGRCRLDCMRIAALCLDEGGCVMVHDYYGRANRYEFGSRFFHTVEHYEKHDTIVYCKPKFGLHKVGL